MKTTAYGMFSSVGAGGHPWVDRARAVKYMANRPAKNISSLESQMIVPTLTMFGRVRECTREVSKVLLATGAVVTRVIMASAGAGHDRGCDGRGGKVISSIPTPARLPREPGRAATRLGAREPRRRHRRSGQRAGLQPPVRGPRRRADGGGSPPGRRRRPDHLARVRHRRRGRRRRRPRAASTCASSTARRSPPGGLALSRQLDEEVADRPAVCVLIARQPDRWLAHWSMAEGTLPLPVDPLTAPGRRGGPAARRTRGAPSSA